MLMHISTPAATGAFDWSNDWARACVSGNLPADFHLDLRPAVSQFTQDNGLFVCERSERQNLRRAQ